MNSSTYGKMRMSSAGTFAVVGVSAALVSGHIEWPTRLKPIYSIGQPNSSYSSFIEENVSIISGSSIATFVREISEFYEALSSDQEPLGAEFEAIWDANLDRLYEA